VTNDTRTAFQPFTVDPAWYREHWFGEGKSAPSRHNLGETRHRPSSRVRILSVIGSALAAAAAVLSVGPSRQAAERS
jgi:hypothetical protein